jgi:predicted GNAT family acetyltransferase
MAAEDDCFIVSMDDEWSKKRRRDNRTLRRGQITFTIPPATSGTDEKSSGEGAIATLDFCYIRTNESTETVALDIQHVYVPPPLRGQGIAERIVKYAFALPLQQGHVSCRIIPSCTYVSQTFLSRHPEFVPPTLLEDSTGRVPAHPSTTTDR